MARTAKKRSVKAGLPPGTLVHIGEKTGEVPKIRIVTYSDKGSSVAEVEKPEDCPPLEKDTGGVTWVDIQGVTSPETMARLGEIYRLHPLLLEDIMNTDQRPKIDAYEDYLFLVIKTLSVNSAEKTLGAEQISLVLGRDFVLTFQECRSAILDPLVERLKTGAWRIGKSGADYLAYSLIDIIIDGYFSVLEQLGEWIDILEGEVVSSPTRKTLLSIQQLKREMIFLRRSVWPLREVAGSMERGESVFIQRATRVYLRDIYDHAVETIDTIETYRDMLSSMLDIYLSSVSNRLNEVMKVLTIISTIFIPLTFVAGLYGMNFEHMPELKWSWAYPAVLVLMALISACMVIYFKKKKWF